MKRRLLLRTSLGLPIWLYGGCGGDKPPVGHVTGPAPLTHPLFAALPLGTVSALYVNYKHLRHDWKDVLEAGATAAQRRSSQGFVEAEDVDHAVIAAVGEGKAQNQLALYEGQFDDESLASSQAASGSALPPYRGKIMWGSDASVIARMSPHQVALGPAAAVEVAIDTRQGAGEALSSEAWFIQANQQSARLWRDKMPVGLELLALATPEVQQRLKPLLPEAADLNWFTLRAGYQTDFRLVGIGYTVSEEAATALVYALAQRIELLAARPQMRLLGLSSVLEAIQFERDGRNVRVLLHIQSEAWSQVRQRFAEVLTFLRQKQAAPGSP